MRSLTAAAAIGLAATLCGGCGAAPRAAPPSCIWIVVDTLRADHLEWYGYGRATAPELRPLVEQGVVFDSAYAALPETSPSIASMLTGLAPYRHGVEHLYDRLSDHNVTAARLLAGAGYRTGAFVSSFLMIRDFSNLGGGFEVYDDFVDEREAYRENYERKAAGTLSLARAWIESHRHEPFFCFIHLIDPHGPYTPPGAFAERFRSHDAVPIPAAVIPPYQRIPGVVDFNRYRDLYDGEIAYSAHELGGFLDYLRGAGLFDPSLIIFNADHGEEMGEHGFYFAHGDDIFEQNVHIPLIIKPPAGMEARRGRRVAQPVSALDLLPTMLAALGQPRPGFLEGRSLAQLLDGGAPDDGAVFFELHLRPPLSGEVRGSRKTLFVDGRLTSYDLATDPGERHPLPPLAADAADLTTWRHAADRWRRPFPVVVNTMAYALRGAYIRGRSHAADDADRRRLRSLGYL
jgi:arylsulfatase A-like enzyme